MTADNPVYAAARERQEAAAYTYEDANARYRSAKTTHQRRPADVPAERYAATVLRALEELIDADIAAELARQTTLQVLEHPGATLSAAHRAATIAGIHERTRIALADWDRQGRAPALRNAVTTLTTSSDPEVIEKALEEYRSAHLIAQTLAAEAEVLENFYEQALKSSTASQGKA